MVKKRKTKSSGSSRGPQIVTVILLAGLTGFLTSLINTTRKKVDSFHQSLFNTRESRTRYSFDLSKLALVITTNLSSNPLPVHDKLKQFPLLNVSMRYKITHNVGFASHNGTIELLGESAAENFKTEFQVIDDQNVSFQSSKFNYKDLEQELNIGAISGKINTNGSSELSISDMEYKSPKFQFSLSGIEINFSKPEEKGQFKASDMNLNGIKLASPEGSFNKQGKISKVNFKTQYNSKLLTIDQTTEVIEENGKPVPVTYGTYNIPVLIVDTALDPGIDAAFAAQEKALMEKKDQKQTVLFNLSKEVNRNSYKMKFLQSFAHARHITKDPDYYKLVIPKDESLEKATINNKEYKLAEAKAEEWIKAGGDKTFELAIYSLHFSYEFFITTAAEIVLQKLEKTFAKDPLYSLLRARYFIKKGYISRQDWSPVSINAAKEILAKTKSDHKLADFIEYKIASINKDDANSDLYLQKFLQKENDPVIKELVQSEKARNKDPQSSLAFLEEAYKKDPKHYALANYLRTKVNLYGQLQDLNSQDQMYKELLALPDPHIFDLINYSGILIHQKRYQEAKPIVEKCFAKTGPNNFCHDYFATVTVKLAYEKFAANDSAGAIQDIENLLITHPASMEAYFALGWIHHKTDIDKATKHYAISCALGASNGCLNAADRYFYDKKDLVSAIPFYEMACEKNVVLACTRLGFRTEEKGEIDVAHAYYKKSCVDLKDDIGCYHLGRLLYNKKSPKDDVANYLDITCKKFQEVCPLSASIRSGKETTLPYHPPGPLAKASP